MILWLQRTLVFLLELLGAALATVLVVMTLLAWRLSEGPMRLENLEPYLVAGLSQLAQPYKISIDQTAMVWGSDRTALGLRASNVRITTPEGTLLATVPEIEVDLSVPALLIGRAAPKVVRLIGPQLRVIRTEAGAIQMGFSDTPTAAPAPTPSGEPDLLQRWLAALSGEPDSVSMMGALREVEIERAKLAVDDYQYHVRWLAPQASFSLMRDGQDVRGDLKLDVLTGDQLSRVTGSLRYDRSDAALLAQLDLDAFNPSRLADWSPAFADFTRFNVPLRGQVQVRWINPIGVAQLKYDLAAGKGELALQPDQPPLKVEYAKLIGAIDRQQRTAEISDLYIDFGGPKINAVARARREGNNVLVDADAQVQAMLANELDRYWLPFIAPGARGWVTHNIQDGKVPSAQARVALTVPLADPAHPQLTSLQGNMRLEGMTVHYFRPLPPVTNAQGVANFDANDFDIEMSGGRLGNLKVPKASVHLLGLNDDADRADIDVLVTGSVADQLTLLDHEPLGYAKRLSIVAAQAAGQATTRARFQFPLLHDLPIGMVAISAAANMENVGLPKLVAGQDLSKGQLALTLDGGGMKIGGTGQVGPASASFNWTESFVADVSPASEITFNGLMDEAGRQAFHVSWPDVVGGQVAVDGRYSKDRGQPATLEAALDFSKASLALPWFAWSKPVGTAAKGNVVVSINRNEVQTVRSFAMDGSGAKVRGRVDFASGSQWQRVVLDQLNAPGSDVKGEIVNKGEAGLGMTLRGTNVDIRGIYEDAATATPPPALTAEQQAAAKNADLLPLDINFDFRRVVTGEGRALHDAKGVLARNQRGWTRLDIDGRLNGSMPARVHLSPTPTGRSLNIETQDAGALLNVLRLSESVRGGVLSVTGQGKDMQPVDATVDMRNFSYLNAETLKKIAQATEPKGAEALARDNGISFSRLKARMIYAQDRVEVKDGRMSGSSMGLTLQGNLNLRAGEVELGGTFVPLYGLNSAVSGIPVIGWLLTGGEGRGVVAATYSVKGPLKDPSISVNPLSMLVPGFLRELFFVDSN